MPELPEVETTKRGIEPHLLKNKLINCKVNNGSFRIPFEKKSFSRVSGFTINEIIFSFIQTTYLIEKKLAIVKINIYRVRYSKITELFWGSNINNY